MSCSTTDRTVRGCVCEGKNLTSLGPQSRPRATCASSPAGFFIPLFAPRTTAEPLFLISPLKDPRRYAERLPCLPRPGAIGPLTARCLGAPSIRPSALTLAAPRLSGAQPADGGLCWAPQIRHLPHRHHLSLLEFIRQGLGCQVLRDPVCLPASNSDPCTP